MIFRSGTLLSFSHPFLSRTRFKVVNFRHTSLISTWHRNFTEQRPPKVKGRPGYVRSVHSKPAVATEASIRNSDPNAVALVVGASRGIGLAITQQLATRWKGRIVATCREPDDAGALSALWQFMPDRFNVIRLDVENEESIQDAVQNVKKWTEDSRVDLLMHTAGILHEGENMPETSLSRVKADWLQKNLAINLMGPVLVAKHFAPLMTTSRKKDRVPSILATLSARVGSISDNSLGGWLSYRASKAGQNQAMKTISIELQRRGVICVALHPGTVATDLSAPFQKNVRPQKLFAVDDAANWLLDVVDSLEIDDTGGFFAYDRKPIPF
eukprot:gb/GEZJ01003157.1/.p1 GENE.gb/GEZJ01003157.1/~~gb/GEZJ01003157.1/.p1  ORF type:complete len:327 (-),score=42.77 gb/GEZJ01003157.1/:348-1328(-)